MKIQIDVQNLQKQIRLDPSQVAQTARKILRHERVRKAQLSIVFVTDQRIKSLNTKYLHHAYATDVLAFDFLDPHTAKKRLRPRTIDGEVIISTGAVCRQAKMFANTNKRELTLYLIHGILHLLGFDDHRQTDIERFRAQEQKILNFLYA